MLQLHSYFVGRPVLSLRTGGQIATAHEPIVNPRNLKLEGFYCEDHETGNELILLCQDVRELSQKGFIVNDQDVLTEPAELVRLRDLLELNFQLAKKPVLTASQQTVGRVGDYAVEMSSMYVQKLYVTPPLLRSLTSGTLSVDRSQIIEVTQKRIIINDPLEPVADMPIAVAA